MHLLRDRWQARARFGGPWLSSLDSPSPCDPGEAGRPRLQESCWACRRRVISSAELRSDRNGCGAGWTWVDVNHRPLPHPFKPDTKDTRRLLYRPLEPLVARAFGCRAMLTVPDGSRGWLGTPGTLGDLTDAQADGLAGAVCGADYPRASVCGTSGATDRPAGRSPLPFGSGCLSRSARSKQDDATRILGEPTKAGENIPARRSSRFGLTTGCTAKEMRRHPEPYQRRTGLAAGVTLGRFQAVGDAPVAVSPYQGGALRYVSVVAPPGRGLPAVLRGDPRRRCPRAAPRTSRPATPVCTRCRVVSTHTSGQTQGGSISFAVHLRNQQARNQQARNQQAPTTATCS